MDCNVDIRPLSVGADGWGFDGKIPSVFQRLDLTYQGLASFFELASEIARRSFGMSASKSPSNLRMDRVMEKKFGMSFGFKTVNVLRAVSLSPDHMAFKSVRS